MNKLELLQKVNQLCREANEDFIFVLEDGSAVYEVSNESSDHLRRLKVLHCKLMENPVIDFYH